MSVLRSIEQKIEGLFEGMFGRAFRTHVQPVELARKLAKEMDEHRTISVSRVYVPNEYSVYLSAQHAPRHWQLQRESAERCGAGGSESQECSLRQRGSDARTAGHSGHRFTFLS